LGFTGVIVALGTLNVAFSMHSNQLAFIDNSDYPGGAAAFIAEQQGNLSNVGAVATSIMMIIASNTFMASLCNLLFVSAVSLMIR